MSEICPQATLFSNSLPLPWIRTPQTAVDFPISALDSIFVDVAKAIHDVVYIDPPSVNRAYALDDYFILRVYAQNFLQSLLTATART